ncbi:MAG: LuxR C-terminal-related transcriptional regulator [Oscillochloridaceae bacterium umkhey_bin13]
MAHGHTPTLLVPTKLVAPQRRSNWIYRERLITQLAEHTHARLISVVAPAGFGKSTLVAQWLGIGKPNSEAGLTPQSPVAWVSLDEHDQDALRFLAYLAGAITQTDATSLTHTNRLIATGAPLGAVLQALLAEVSSMPHGLRIVLDDYHAITETEIHRAVAHMLRQLPANCQLVLISRVEPPLPLARLRAAGQLFEIGATELRFTAPETADLLTSLTGDRPSMAQVTTLNQQTDGWPLAIQLAILAGHTFSDNSVNLGLARRQITEYLADEVFDRQPAAIQAALLALAIPDRFCPGLSAVLLDCADDLLRAENLLDQLVRANLFLIPLDSQGQWFRFHHLFRDLLLRRLMLTTDPLRIRELQRRAAAWLITAQDYEGAVRLLLATDSHETAVELVETRLREEFQRHVSSTPPGYWLSLLPTELINRRPSLILLAARLSIFNMDMGDLARRLDLIESLLADPQTASHTPWPNFQADLTALRAILAYWEGRPSDAISLIQHALALGPTSPLPVQCLLQQCVAMGTSTPYPQAVAWVQNELAGFAPMLGSLYAPLQATALTLVHQIAGELTAQTQATEALADLVATGNYGDLWAGYAHASLGLAAYERNDLATAEAHFSALMPLKYRASYLSYMSGVIGMAMLAVAHNDRACAKAYADEAMAFADEIGGPFLRHQALGCAIRVALAYDDLDTAREAANLIQPDVHLGHSLTFETPRLSQVQALLRSGDPHLLPRADHLLANCLQEVRALNNVRLQIAALALQAWLRRGQGRTTEAGLALDQAVALAAPRGFTRVFLDLGAVLSSLLTLNLAPATRRFLQTQVTPNPANPSDLVLLTPREHEILALLAERWSDKEIAARLVIAPNTVRKHTGTIYQKLGVSSRREAVAVARANGLLNEAQILLVER